MSRQRLGKKPQPAKKACKSFTNTLQSKVHIPIKTTIKHFHSIFHFLCHHKPTIGHRFPTTNRSYVPSNYHHVHGKNFSAVSVQDLFAERAFSVHVTHAQREASIGKDVFGNKDVMEGESSGIDTIADAWRAVAAKSPQLQVDEMAEEFISKFGEDMRLQKERSLANGIPGNAIPECFDVNYSFSVI